MCANPARHRAERRWLGAKPNPESWTAKQLLASKRDLGIAQALRADGTYAGSPMHARKATTGYAKYIGRVGALAVSLGVGVAVATTPGVAYANPETDPESPSATPPDSQPTTDTGTPPDTTPLDPPTTTSPDLATDTSPTQSDSTETGDGDGVPAMNYDSSGGALTSTYGNVDDTDSGLADDEEPSQYDEEEESTLAESESPTEPLTPVEEVVPPPAEPPLESTPPSESDVAAVQDDSQTPDDVQEKDSDGDHALIAEQSQNLSVDTAEAADFTPTYDAAVRSFAFVAGDEQTFGDGDTQITAFSAQPLAAPVAFDPLAAVMAIPGTVINLASAFVAAVLGPFLVPGPAAPPPQMPVLWAVLAWVRREISHTFFNRTPIANPVQNPGQSLTAAVTGDLNAFDPNCDPLAYTVTEQGQFGTVVVNLDGTYTYTPTVAVPSTGLNDTFTVVINDSVGTHLPGLLGVVQGVLHCAAQLIGLAQPDTLVVEVPVSVTGVPVNLPPVVTTTVAGPIYTPGSPPVVLNPSVTVIDADSATLSGASVSIGLGFVVGEDTLGYAAPSGSPIDGSYDPATGVLTLTGTGTAAEYQAALRAVTFSTSAGALASIKAVSIVVTDSEGQASLPAPVAVTVLGLPVNVPPLVVTSVVGPIYTAGTAPVTVDSSVTVIDLGSANMSGATVRVTVGAASGDALSFTAPVGSSITGSYDSVTRTLTLTGTGTIAQYQEVLRSVTFSTSSSALASIKAVEFVVTDAQGADSVPGLVAVTVVALPVDVPPLVTTSVVGPIYTAGSLPVTVDSAVTVTDLDSTDMAGATATITVGSASGDTLSFTAPAGSSITGDYDSATGTLTLTGTGTAVQYQEALRSVRFASSSSAPAALKSVAFVVTDAEGQASLPGLVAVTVVALPVGVPPLVVTSVVGPIYTAGNAPVVVDSAVSITDLDSTDMSGATATIAVGLASGDVLSFTAPAGSSINGSYDSGTGTLTLTGTGTGTAAEYQEALRSVRFASSSSAPAALKSVAFVVTDVEGQASLPGLVAVTVLAVPVDVPPLLTTSTVGPVYTAGNAPVVVDSAVSVTDVDSTSISGATVTITVGLASGDALSFSAPAGSSITGAYDSGTGALTLTGVGSAAQYEDALRSVTFSTSSSALAAIKTVSFVVTDAEGQASLPGLVAVTVLAVPIDIAPLVVTAPVGPVYTAGSAPVVVDSTVFVTDVDSTSMSSAMVTITVGLASGDVLSFTAPAGSSITGTYNSGTGELTLTGTGTLAQYQEALRSVTFASSSSAVAAIKSVEFVVTDIEGQTSLPALVAVTVLAAPVDVAPLVVTSLANVTYTAGNSAVTLDPAVTVIDLDSVDMLGATVKITVGFASGDTLAFTPPAGSSITGTYNSTTGELTLTGVGTIAQYQEALRSVTFSTSSSAVAAIKTVSILVTDVEEEASLPGSVAVTVLAAPINLPPLVSTSLLGPLLYSDGSPAETLDPLIAVTDLDSTMMSGATVTITAGKATGDTLAFTVPAGSSITGAYNSTTGELTLTGTGTTTQYQEALRSVTFFSPFTLLGSLVRTISVVVTDEQGDPSVSLPLFVTVV